MMQSHVMTVKSQVAEDHALQTEVDPGRERILAALAAQGQRIAEFHRPTDMTVKTTPLPTILRRTLNTETNFTVMFTSAYDREEAPRTAFETARSAALQARGKVLYFHVSDRPARFFLDIEDRIPAPLDDFVSNSGSNAQPFVALENSGLVCAYIRGQAEMMGRENIVSLVSCLRKHFELTVIGGDSLLMGGASLAFSDLVDGTVLVAEAERTRAPVMQKTKRLVEENGGKVVGAVLNRREFHVPGWIYRLFYGGSSEFSYRP